MVENRVSLNIVLIEQDTCDYHFIRDILREVRSTDYQLELEWVQSCDDALAAVARSGCDLYLLGDLSDEKAGTHFLHEIRKRGSQAPTIFLTRRETRELDINALRAGAADCLEKEHLTGLLLDRSIRYALARKEVERSIVRAKKEWEDTFDAISDPIAIIDTRHCIVRLNRAMAKRLGKEPGELIGRKCFEVVHRLTSIPPFCPHAMLLREGREHSAEVYEENLGGHFLVSASPYYDDQGRLIGSIHFARDITSRKRMEDALRQANELLELRVKERTEELQTQSQQLEESNAALRVLLRQRDDDRRELEEAVVHNVNTLVHPCLEKLRKTSTSGDHITFVDMIESHLNQIISPFMRSLSDRFPGLTPTEVRVISLVKEGRTNKEIAEILHLSENTIKFHRYNARCKLGVKGRKKNLRACLSEMT